MRRHQSRTGEGELDGTHDGGGRSSAGVASAGGDAEGGVTADGVGEVLVLSFPGSAVLVERQPAGEEEDARPRFAPRAHPVSMETHRAVTLGRQDRRMMKIGRRDNLTDSTAPAGGLRGRTDTDEQIV